MEENTELPAQFVRRRTSYCNQEDDEDRTDIEGKPVDLCHAWPTSLSPSLHVTAILYIALARLFPDLKVLDCEESSLESTPFASPTRQLRTPKKVAAVRRPLYRPSRPNSENAPKTSYVAIVNRWLYPYMDEKSSISHIHSTYRPVH